MIKRKIQIGEHSINLIEREGTQGTIISVHGNSMSVKSWYKQFESELLKEYHILAVDLPGHGDSSRSENPDEDYNVLSYAAVLSEVIKKEVEGKYILVGFSLGSNVIIECLPEINKCIGIILEGATLVHKKEEISDAYQSNEHIAVFFTEAYTENGADFFSELNNGLKEIPWPDYIKEDFINTDPKCRSYLMKSIGEEKLSDELGILQKLKIPIMLLLGAEEKILNMNYFRRMANTISSAEFDEIPNAGHLAHLANAEEFNRQLNYFCDKNFK